MDNKLSHMQSSIYLHRSSGTDRETSKRFPDQPRSRPERGCTPACCSTPAGHPRRPAQGAETFLGRWIRDSDPYSSDCSYSPWGAPGTEGQPRTLWQAHCCAPAESPWCFLAWLLEQRSSFRGEADDGERRGERPAGERPSWTVSRWESCAFPKSVKNRTKCHILRKKCIFKKFKSYIVNWKVNQHDQTFKLNWDICFTTLFWKIPKFSSIAFYCFSQTWMESDLTPAR